MLIILNDKKTEIEADTSIQAILKSLDIPEKGVAVAVNDEIVSKAQWDSFKFTENDNVLIIRAASGG